MSDDPDDIDLDEFSVGGGGGGSSGRGGSGPKEGAGAGRWLWLLVGIALGVAASLLVPRYLAPHLPPALGGGLVSVQGEVLDKERESGRLLLTLDSERGAMLATFRERVSELDLLVGRGDSVTVAMAEFRPFVDDPRLLGVKKGQWEGRVPATPATGGDQGAESGDRPGAAEGAEGTGDTAGAPRSGEREDARGAPPAADSAARGTGAGADSAGGDEGGDVLGGG